MGELNCKASKHVQEIVSKKNAKLICMNDKPKYSKKQFLKVYKGYDMCENIFTVRTYIQKKYKIEQEFLELLLRLMGLNFFTMRDFFDTPRNFTYKTWRSIRDSGYINLVMDDDDTMKRIFCLNKKGSDIIVDFYECLSGEKKMSEDPEINPMANSEENVAFDNKKMELIKKLNALPVPPHKKYLFNG